MGQVFHELLSQDEKWVIYDVCVLFMVCRKERMYVVHSKDTHGLYMYYLIMGDKRDQEVTVKNPNGKKMCLNYL